MKRAPEPFTDTSDSSLLDVFVIGSHAHEQLNRFFKITKIFASPSDFYKSTDKMELAELNGNKAMAGSNSAFSISPHQQIINSQQSQSQAQQQQLTNNQIAMNSHLYRNHNQQQQQQQQPGLRYTNNSRVVEHRELPVDVPDSFVGVAKQSPRYPPPKPHRQVSPSMPMGNMTTFNSTPSTVSYNSNAQNNFAQQPAIHPISQNTAANILSHNSSLRSSIKLKQLEKSRGGQNGNFPVGQMQPAINQAFELNEDDMITGPGSQMVDPSSTNRTKHSTLDVRAIYSRLERNLNGEFAGVSSDVKLAKLVSIYDTIIQTHDKQFNIPSLTSRHTTTMNAQGNPEPVTFKVLELLRSILHLFEGDMMTEDVAELLAILCKHEVGAVCSAFDRIAQSFEFAKLSDPPSSPSVEMVTENSPPATNIYLPKPNTYQMHGNHIDGFEFANDQVHMDIENNLYQNSIHPLTEIDLSDGTRTKTVCIEKACHQPLGATIKNDSDGCVLIGRIVYGGAAHLSGLLHEGDELVEVNGVGMRGKNVNDVVDLLESMNGTLTCTVLTRNYNKPPRRNLQEKILVKAFFRYDADKDDFIPCKELGLSFERGEILTIIDQSDPKWWQAYREDSPPDCRLASLIPSINFLKQRERDTEHEDFTTLNYKQERKNLVSFLLKCPKGSSSRRRKKPPNFPFGPEETQYYEEVGTYYPKECGKRPIILVGPKNIGQREIVARLTQDKNRFAQAISHTSRRQEENERNGVSYHFVSRAQFETLVKAGEFIEFGLYQNEYYGTTLDAMKEVVRANKTCIHLVNTTSIFNFRQGRAGSELKPFFVFVKPDDSYPEKLKNIVTKYSSAKSNIENNIKAAVEEIELIETHYLPYFDMVLTVTDVERAYQKLLSEITRLEEQPSWIPKFWDQQ